VNWIDRLILWIAPSWGRSRVMARVMARHFEAASVGRRTSGWSRMTTDANRAAGGATLSRLRAQARDLVRNNPWARRGLRRIVTNTVGWGIKPKANGRNAGRITELWKLWAETTQCDAAGRLTMYGLQKLVMRTIVESGEVLIRRRISPLDGGLAIPLQLQVLEPDYIDTGRDGMLGEAGGPIIQGIEFDGKGRRVAYWLFEEHPGSNLLGSSVSKRVAADGILHVFDQERAGQVRGTSWFAPVDVRLHDFDEFEDATLMKQKIAACMAAFVTDLDGTASALGKADTVNDQPIDSLEPGMIIHLPQGKQVEVASPPQATDHQSYSATALRGVAAGLGVTYEDLTGDYSQVNYSSARMARIAHNADVHDWRWNMLIPQFCVPVWDWMVETMKLAGLVGVVDAPPTWTPPPLPMLDPGKESEATQKAVRTGEMTLSEAIRQQGQDPDQHLREYADDLKRLDELGIVLDSDPRKTDGSGQRQKEAAQAPASAPSPTTNGVSKKPAVIADA
jgi:lambda family phage portal protein